MKPLNILVLSLCYIMFFSHSLSYIYLARECWCAESPACQFDSNRVLQTPIVFTFVHDIVNHTQVNL